MAEPSPSRVRTRLAPVLFALAVLPVAALAVWFHGMSLRAVESVLERQTLAAVRSAASGVGSTYRDLLAVGSLPARSRVVREALGAPTPPRNELRAYARWFLANAGSHFAQIIFVDGDGAPVDKYDPGSVGAIDQQIDAVQSGQSAAAPTFEPSDGGGLPGSGQRLRISVQSTIAHGQVFRFARPVGGGRRPGRAASTSHTPSGYVSLDVPVDELLTLRAGDDIELLLIDDEAGGVLLSPDPLLQGQPVVSALPGLAAILAAVGDSTSASVRFTEAGIERVASFARLDEPSWTVIAWVDAGPYVAGPRATGRLTLAATGLFVLLSGALIIFLVTRVQRRTALLQDANEQLEEQNRLVQEANERIARETANKSQFLRRMSHDLRSPMNAIIGFTRVVLRKAAGRLDERQVRNLRHIETSSRNLLHLINDILDLSRIEAGRIDLKPQSVDLCQLAGECADALASLTRPGVELRRELANLPPVTTDPDRLRQVIMNLLGNAVKFTAAGHITLSVTQHDGSAEIAVADTGIGIPAADLPHVFDEFRQVERQGGEASEGTGLGLSIAKKTVELLGGSITADSVVGEGTIFVVRLGDSAP